MSNKIADLDDKIKDKARKALAIMGSDVELARLGAAGVCVVETRRDLAVQFAYYSRGRTSRDFVRALYKRCGLYTPTDAECDTANTQTLYSKHIDGLAVDFAPLKDNGSIWWSAPASVWERMGTIGESCGLSWGGRWKGFKDTPHFEV